ncbi:MAG: NAD(+) synthase [Candidatus Yanofskybacteria bacterium RIFCSPHIGHO2_02_FULL_41_11]|uniref:Glutamine-dependent NAD(+) synthetase n=1 Tax=Candidatus Yanofskybacteria bacterium RIFCSPHIGHO2_02_FULL_41_11 TaxID=1802675 RepID=A0A1F8F9K4_9BACT|nr:MAG: NAD(+) synthase [Candidatus Yanofskybacteria bacterium RIFCSPHIGHO2_02_FULL_41_11]
MAQNNKMEKLKGLKISLCQMRVIPGRPDINAEYIIREIKSAYERGSDIIIFPELCTSGYLIGDKFEDACFIDDIQGFNREIVESVPENLVVIFGSVVVSFGKGEDGRQRMHNAAIVAQGGRPFNSLRGRQLGYTVKTLQPHYRYFDDDKHLFSARKIAEETAEIYRKTGGREGVENCSVHDLLKVYDLKTSIGLIKVGVGICEDLWKDDYALNPAAVLAEKGAQLLIAISASPWGWQKNRKRHQVIKNLTKEIQVPVVYVNNTGCQNNGDNIINFDGASTIYSDRGEIIYEVESYSPSTQNIVWGVGLKPVAEEAPQDDTKELYLGIRTAVKDMLDAMPEEKRRVVIGLSGGVDSATMAALVADILGPERVYLINMPYEYSDPNVRNVAQKIASNLGINLKVSPIKGIVDAICEQTHVEKGTLAHQNVQARARMEILAAETQKLGGVFTCNANKTEIAFGYGTLDGDMRGWLVPFGDLVKREVRQLARYLNKEIYKREVIPQECIEQIPSAELEKDQKDPFDYGYPDKRGYHDEWVRAVTEFRWNPEKFLEMYLNGKLESELILEPGTLNRLFPTPKAFVEDLERCWQMFNRAFFKRVQSPPIIIVSRRAFGRDLEESMLSSHYTQHYLKIKEELINKK